MDRIVLDTTFLIDLQNERRGRGRSRGASAFLRVNRSAEFFVPTRNVLEFQRIPELTVFDYAHNDKF